MSDPQRPESENESPPNSGGTALDDLVARHGGRRIALIVLALLVVIAPPVVWAVTRDSKQPKPAVGPTADQAAAVGCQLHDFEYGVTNEESPGRAYQREALLGNHPPLPNAGYRAGDAPPKLPVVLHTLAHGWLVVKYNEGLDQRDRERLRQFAKAGGADVAVVPGGPSLNAGVAAIRWGHGLDCAEASVEAMAVLREFEKLEPKLD